MPQNVTIVMYHYVRDLAHSRFPELKCLDFFRFQRQLDHLAQRYTFVDAESIARALAGGPPLPDQACLLTFDDGYLDHYTAVFPELANRGIPGAFYPPVLATQRNVVMEVNKIQLILAQNGYENIASLVSTFSELFQEIVYPVYADIPDYLTLYNKYAIPSRYDCADVMFIKAMLQYALPLDVRKILIDALFSKIVNIDEEMLAQEMYMSVDMLKVMKSNGMHIGSHGDKHRWLDKLTPTEQLKEVESSLHMLGKVYQSDDFIWSMCYPFGGVNDSLKEICSAKKCAFGLVTKTGIAHVDQENKFTLSRFDTNDFPVA